MRRTLEITYKLIRRIAIFIIGMTIVIIGIIMFVTPGPAIIVIPAGLAILSIEFAWARHWLKVMKEKTKKVVDKAGNLKNSNKDKENNSSKK
ncbi:MAG: PGPGW domain-containing protein [Gammaproteobacteria bacterium]